MNKIPNDYLAVTVSDYSGARHFSWKKITLRRLLIGSALVLSIIPLSTAYNWLQHRQYQSLDEHATHLTTDNNALNQRIATHDQRSEVQRIEIARRTELLSVISAELERTAGVGPIGGRSTLEQRLHNIVRYYGEKEEEYAELETQLSEVEKLLGLDEPKDRTPRTVTARSNAAWLSALLENTLHSSIPNGYPMDSRKITSGFGKRIHPVTKRKENHNGVDLRAKRRIKVYTTADGTVRSAKYSRISGNRIIVSHNFGFNSYYAHLSKMTVKPGDIIQKGDVIGISGNSGRSSGPHLHYEIRYIGRPLDPTAFLKWGVGSKDIFNHVKAVKWQSLISRIQRQIIQQMSQLSRVGLPSLEK